MSQLVAGYINTRTKTLTRISFLNRRPQRYFKFFEENEDLEFHLLRLVLNLILIKPYGFYGAAISSVVSMAFWNFLGVFIIWKKHKILLAYIPFR